jgi:hypothetical protein
MSRLLCRGPHRCEEGTQRALPARPSACSSAVCLGEGPAVGRAEVRGVFSRAGLRGPACCARGRACQGAGAPSGELWGQYLGAPRGWGAAALAVPKCWLGRGAKLGHSHAGPAPSWPAGVRWWGWVRLCQGHGVQSAYHRGRVKGGASCRTNEATPRVKGKARKAVRMTYRGRSGGALPPVAKGRARSPGARPAGQASTGRDGQQVLLVKRSRLWAGLALPHTAALDGGLGRI